MGDLAGFAAAVYLRGIAFLQAPTTLLAQIDASVGGKTAVNTREGKNLIGAFHQPRAVVISTETLQTLPWREMTAGWCEAIKQGAVGDRRLYEQTRRFLVAENENKENEERARESNRTHESNRAPESQPAGRRADELAALIAAQCAFKAKIVAADVREEVGRTDARSRRILNFGHTAAHALEAVTGYRRFRHGEAVGYGMLVAAEISHRLGMLAASELESIRACIRLAGRLPRADDLEERAVLRAMRGTKKASAAMSVGCCWKASGGRESSAGRRFRPASSRRTSRRAVRPTSKTEKRKLRMSHVRDENFRAQRATEHGGSRFNFLLT